MEEEQKLPHTNEALVYKSSKKKKQTRTVPNLKPQKAPPKRIESNKQERLLLNPDSTTSGGDEYRTLRRKYLLLEEESFGLGKELKEVEDDIKAMEDEKLSLLDELVVLEGLIDPSEIRPQSRRLA